MCAEYALNFFIAAAFIVAIRMFLLRQSPNEIFKSYGTWTAIMIFNMFTAADMLDVVPALIVSWTWGLIVAIIHHTYVMLAVPVDKEK